MHKYIPVFIFFIAFFSAQNNRLDNLEQTVIKLNRLGKQKESQDRILAMLSENISDKETIHLQFMLANTFRSINDYSSAIYYLQEAKKSADLGHIDDSLKATLDAELAFATFDNNDYPNSEKIINNFKKNNYKYQSQENKAYLIMQDGYLKFLRKNYDYAEKSYNESLDILKNYSFCNQPAVMVKQIQLYAAMNNIKKSQMIYDSCIVLADKCRILKYKIYATEELSIIYRNSGNKDKFFYYTKILNSMQLTDKQEKRLSLMHVSSQDYLEKKNKKQAGIKNLLIFICLLILCASILSIIILRKRRNRESRQYEELIAKIRADLDDHNSGAASPAETEIEAYLKILSKRQRDIVAFAIEGLTNKEIAENMCVTEATVKYHFKNIFEILEIKNRKDLFKLFIKK